jgi:hypothetical protein
MLLTARFTLFTAGEFLANPERRPNMSKKTEHRPRESGKPSHASKSSKLIREAKVTTRDDLRRDTYTTSDASGAARRA